MTGTVANTLCDGIEWEQNFPRQIGRCARGRVGMSVPPTAAIAERASRTLPRWARLAPGFAVCAAIAGAASIAGEAVPLVGAPLFAIAIGVLVANMATNRFGLGALRVGEIGKLSLKAGIVILGASLNLTDIAHTGGNSLLFLAITVAVGLATSLLVGRSLGIDWRIRCLIGMGTTICGASAIAALAPVIRAKAEEIAYSVTVVFFFNMIAVFLFPPLGHVLGLSDNGFGIWAGTAVNDTSAVVAAGFAFSNDAGTIATVVKLTRTTLIIPLVICFGLALPWLDPSAPRRDVSLARRVYDSFPVFILLFVAASLLQTLGLTGGHAGDIQFFGRAVMVVALAAVGLQGHWRTFAGAGARPLLLGALTWAAVALASLLVQTMTQQL
jgi:uncharacterized integral membrane protein (TIGR00698 family)